jgi:hypothetical protein
MKQLCKTPMISLITLALIAGVGTFYEWRNWRVILLVPCFLFSLLFLVVLVQQRLSKKIRSGDAVNHAKAGHVS